MWPTRHLLHDRSAAGRYGLGGVTSPHWGHRKGFPQKRFESLGPKAQQPGRLMVSGSGQKERADLLLHRGLGEQVWRSGALLGTMILPSWCFYECTGAAPLVQQQVCR